MDLEHLFASQLQAREKPYLLALSGGPDSMALFHLLKRSLIPFAVAHVDHRMRQESGDEACFLKNLCEREKIPFHLHVVERSYSHNIEAMLREERYQFFLSLLPSYDALLLGHQRDEKIETTLKRVLEGSSLFSLSGMKAHSLFGGYKVIRPLLSIPKSEIYAFLKKNNYPYFEDPTNHQNRFLRGRMRNTLLPQLSESFGKNIAGPLYALSKKSEDLEAYLLKKLQKPLGSFIEGPLGKGIDLNPFDLEPLEIEFLLKETLHPMGLSLSFPLMESILLALREKKASKKFQTKELTFFTDRGRLFIIWNSILGQFKEAQWEKGEVCSSQKTTFWDLLQGRLVFVSSELSKATPSLKKKWSDQKIPSFLWPLIPFKETPVGLLHPFSCLKEGPFYRYFLKF